MSRNVCTVLKKIFCFADSASILQRTTTLVPFMSSATKSAVQRVRLSFLSQTVAAAVMLFGGLVPGLHMTELLESSEVLFAEDEVVSHVGAARFQRASSREQHTQREHSDQVHWGARPAHTSPSHSAVGHCFCDGRRLPMLC